MTDYSRSVLKSSSLCHSKNLPVKFGFSLKTVPANIDKKLPSQRCSKPLFIAFFNFSHKWPTFTFVHESGYTLGFQRKIAHKGTHAETGAFPPRPQQGFALPVKSLQSLHLRPLILPRFYIHTFPDSLCPPLISRREISGKVAVTTLFQTAFHRVFQPLAQMAHVRFHG